MKDMIRKSYLMEQRRQKAKMNVYVRYVFSVAAERGGSGSTRLTAYLCSVCKDCGFCDVMGLAAQTLALLAMMSTICLNCDNISYNFGTAQMDWLNCARFGRQLLIRQR